VPGFEKNSAAEFLSKFGILNSTRRKFMSKSRSLLLILFFIACTCAVSAQTTIFNIPSTDVMPEGRFLLELDFVSHFDRYDRGGFQSYGYRTSYGLGKRVEVGANFYYTRAGRDKSPKEFQPNIKWQPYKSEKYGVAVTSGLQFFVPLNKSAGSRVHMLLYANASKTIKQTNGTRLTGGFYSVFGAERDYGTKTGVILGIEQPMFRRVSFIGDWYSGNNRLGYVSAGLNFVLTPRQFLTLGYSWGNSGRGNNAFSAFYGYTF
jgi:hypothetical protein